MMHVDGLVVKNGWSSSLERHRKKDKHLGSVRIVMEQQAKATNQREGPPKR